MLNAQVIINPLKALSAKAELPRASRKRRTSEILAAGGEGFPEDNGPGATSPDSESDPEEGAEAVSGFLIRISDNGTVTCLRLTGQYEWSVNGLLNQAHTARFPAPSGNRTSAAQLDKKEQRGGTAKPGKQLPGRIAFH
jgi:hypothetical protein